MINISNYRDISVTLTLFRISYFGAAHRWDWAKNPSPLAKLQLTQRRYKKYLSHPMSSADISIFHQKSAHFAIQEIKI